MTTDTTTAAQLGNALAANYLLVELSVSRWQATKTDKRASADTIARNHAARDAGRFVKNLLAGADAELRQLNSVLDRLRAHVYDSTAPWAAGDGAQLRGPRLLSVTRAPAFLAEHAALKAESDSALAAFLSAYPAARARAMSALNGLGNATDYPEPEALAARYNVAMSVEPLPAASDYSRASLPADMAAAFADQLAAAQAKKLQTAQADVIDRATEHLTRIATQLAKLDDADAAPRLHQSLIDSGRALAGLLRDTAAGDFRIIDAADRIERDVLNVPSLDAWRHGETKRKSAAAAALSVAVDLVCVANPPEVAPVAPADAAQLPDAVVIPDVEFF